jgi:hypothetical protein
VRPRGRCGETPLARLQVVKIRPRVQISSRRPPRKVGGQTATVPLAEERPPKQVWRDRLRTP